MYAIDAKAAAPTRANGSIVLSWGMMTIPLSVYAGSEETRVQRKEFVKGDPDRPVGRAAIDKSLLPTVKVVEAGDVVRMAQATNGTWVELADEEIAACTLARGVAEVVSFVPRSSVWEYLPEDIGQVRPQTTKGKSNPAVEKAFSLLLTAMTKDDVCALIKFSLRGPARFGLLTSTGDLIYVKTSDQIRQPLPLNLVPVDQAHLDAASQLIAAIGTGAPKIVNETAEAVQKFVDAKAAGKPAPAAKPVNNMSDDLMASLAASIEKAQSERVS